MTRRPRPCKGTVLGLVGTAWLLNQARWARRTRPELLPEAPAGSRNVQMADGTRLHAQVGGATGASTTVVLVHGFLARSLEFDMQWNGLAGRVRTIRYDHRNHGRSQHVPGPLAIATLAGDLEEIIDQLIPVGNDVVLVGHSMGGMTVLALAAREPDLFGSRVKGVALLATGAGHYVHGHPWENAFRWMSRRGLLGPVLMGARLAAPALEQIRPRRTHLMRWAVRHVAFGTDDIDPAVVTMTQSLLEEPPLTTITSLQGSILRHDALSGLAPLRELPVLVMTGTEDTLTRPEHSASMARDLGPRAELVMAPGAGHVLNQTRPVEVNTALHRLLDRVEAAAAAKQARLAGSGG